MISLHGNIVYAMMIPSKLMILAVADPVCDLIPGIHTFGMEHKFAFFNAGHLLCSSKHF
jgi:hypothetical protein